MKRQRLFGILRVVSLLALTWILPAEAAKDRVVVAFGSNIPTLDPHMHSSRQ